MASSGKKRSSARFALIAIAILAVLLFGGLSAGWSYLAGELDRRVASAIDAAAGGGTSIDCANRAVFGYPFRLGIVCDTIAVDAPADGVRASGGSLRTAAQIYAPNRIVAELAGPVTLETPDLPPLDLRWELAQASTTLWSQGLDRLSVAIDNGVLALVQPAADRLEIARSERLEFHVRQNEGDLDLALVDRAVVATPPGLGALPSFDLTADLTVEDAAGWLAGGVPGGTIETALRGQAGTLRSITIGLAGGGAAELGGPFSISPEGEISGDFRIAIADPQAIADLVATLVPGSAGVASTLAGAIGFAGRQENGRTVIEVRVRDGRAQMGFIPLGRIPAI